MSARTFFTHMASAHCTHEKRENDLWQMLRFVWPGLACLSDPDRELDREDREREDKTQFSHTHNSSSSPSCRRLCSTDG